MNSQTDNLIRDLVEKSKDDNQRAYRELYNMLVDKIFAYTVSRVSSRSDAFDVVQEVFIDLWQALPKFSHKSDKQFYSFVFLIAKRRLIKYYRSQKRVEELSEEHSMENYDSFVEYNPNLIKIIGELKEKHQDVIRLRYWSHLSFSEISNYLNITESAAKVRHHRALKNLKSKLKDYD